MSPDQFVSYLRAEHLDGLVEGYCRMFDETPLESFTDGSMRELARFWKSGDDATRGLLAKFIRLGSQNTMASVLSVLDNTASAHQGHFSLTIESRAGEVSVLSEDLLEWFWQQEEGSEDQRP